jgi:hypothetical protein
MVIKRDFVQEMIDHTYNMLKKDGEHPNLMLRMDWHYFIVFQQYRNQKTGDRIHNHMLHTLPFYPDIYRSCSLAVTEAFK